MVYGDRDSLIGRIQPDEPPGPHSRLAVLAPIPRCRSLGLARPRTVTSVAWRQSACVEAGHAMEKPSVDSVRRTEYK
jgi:hypothetical protein